MEIRLITEEDFKQFSGLVIDMYKEVDKAVNEFYALNILMHEYHAFEDFIAIGLFENSTLKGFTFGRKFKEKSFYFCGIYVIIRNNEWTKKLIDFSFEEIAKRGYTSWVVDATNPNIGSIMIKYNAKEQYTRYEGDL